MIRFIKRKNLNVLKYDYCIENSIQSTIYAYSWYLDIVADNWSVLVLNDYEAVMPVPWRKKYNIIKYVYQPLWTLQLGVYSKAKIVESDFVDKVLSSFLFVSLKMNLSNKLINYKRGEIQRIQSITLNKSYVELERNYNRNRKRELKKATNNTLRAVWGGDEKKLIDLFKKNIGLRIPDLVEKDYKKLSNLIRTCREKKKGDLLFVFDIDRNLVSAAFFVKHKERVTEVVCSSDFANRENGANTFMNDIAIQKYYNDFEVFDFGGSSREGIAKYYRSFSARDEEYVMLKKFLK